MKYVFLFLLLLPTAGYSQQIQSLNDLPIDSSTGDVVYTEVVKIDSASVGELYSRAKLFVANTYKSSKDVTQLNDDGSKTVLIKPIIPLQFKGFTAGAYNGYANYQLKIEAKDNRYRYRIEGFSYSLATWSAHSPGASVPLSELKSKKFPKKVADEIAEKIDLDIRSLIERMKKQMATNNSDF